MLGLHLLDTMTYVIFFFLLHHLDRPATKWSNKQIQHTTTNKTLLYWSCECLHIIFYLLMERFNGMHLKKTLKLRKIFCARIGIFTQNIYKKCVDSSINNIKKLQLYWDYFAFLIIISIYKDRNFFPLKYSFPFESFGSEAIKYAKKWKEMRKKNHFNQNWNNEVSVF